MSVRNSMNTALRMGGAMENDESEERKGLCLRLTLIVPLARSIKRLFIRSSFGSNSTVPQTVAAAIATLARRMGTVKRNGLRTAGPYPVRF